MDQHLDTSKIQLLEDQPALTDEFEGKAHQRLARALAEIITVSPGGKAIGLEGTWGSGKSTVVNLASQLLEQPKSKDQPGRIVFIFDAWAHQNDPIRAVFLQEAIKAASPILGAASQTKWAERLKSLKAKHKQTTEQVREKLSLVARVALLVLPVYAVAAALMKQWEDKTLFSIPLQWVLGIILLSPYIVAGLTWLHWRPAWCPTKIKSLGRRWFEHREPHTGRSLLRLYSRETDERTTDQTIYEIESTTIEFNAAFDELVADLKSAHHQLVIVLDNLDRLPADAIRTTWATMRNFFAATPNTPRADILRQVWLIVPFDRHHIEGVFSTDNGSDAGANDGKQRATHGFIEKTFSIVLRVAPPALSDYRSYLHNALKSAFSNQLTDDELEAAFKLFDIYHVENPFPVTPRQIKSYVNALVTQVRQWERTIPLAYQALYVLVRDSRSLTTADIKDPDLIKPRTKMFLRTNEWQRYLAAAHLNLEPDKALQVLLSTEIKKALIDGDLEAIGRQQSTLGFDEVLVDIILESAGEWVQSEPATAINVAATLSAVNIQDAAIKRQVWRLLTDEITKISSPITTDERTQTGFCAAIRNAPEASACAKVALAVMTKVESPPSDVDAGKLWAERVDQLADCLLSVSDKGTVSKVFANILLPGDAAFMIGAIPQVSAWKAVSPAELKIAGTEAEITAKLVEQCTGPSGPNEGFAKAVSVLLGRQLVNIASLVTAVEGRINTHSPLHNVSTAGASLRTLATLPATNKHVKNAIKRIIDGGQVHGLLHKLGGVAENDLTIYSIILLCRQDIWELSTPATTNEIYGDLAPIKAALAEVTTNPGAHGALISGIAKNVCDLKEFTRVLDAAIKGQAYSVLYQEVVRKAVNDAIINDLEPSDVIEKFDAIASFLGPEQSERFLHIFEDWSVDDVDEFFSGKNWINAASSFLTLGKKIGAKHAAAAINGIVNRMKALSQEEWLAALDAESDILRLLLLLIRLDENVVLGRAYYDALFDHARAVLNSGKIPTVYRDEWPSAAKALSNSARATFYDTLRDEVLSKSHSSVNIAHILRLYGDDLTAEGRLVKKADDAARLVLLPLTADVNEENSATIAKYEEAFKNVWSNASDSTRQAIGERLTEQRLVGGAEIDRIDAIATAFGITIQTPEVSEAGTPENQDT